jgi:NAD(P)H-nitrite reductase large subunit
MANKFETTRVTIVLPAGRLPLSVMDKANEVAKRYNLEVYLSTSQNLRLMGIKDEDAAAIKAELAEVGAEFKAPGKFPVPRVCIGKRDCTMGIGDPEHISQLILDKFSSRAVTKPKFKIAVSGCTLSCAGVMTTDIGVITTRKGLDIYVGGKGGPHPNVARRIVRDADEQTMLKVIEELVEFHDAHTKKKQRMFKLIDHLEFPYKEAV